MVQVAVPEQMKESPDLDSFLIDSLRQANCIAFRVFAEKGMDFPLREAEDLVSRVEQTLRENEAPCVTTCRAAAPSAQVAASRKRGAGEVPRAEAGSKKKPPAGKRNRREKHWDELVVVRMPTSSRRDLAVLVAIEDDIIAALPPSLGDVDGHEFGSGEMYIFIFANAPVPVFALLRGILEKHGVLHSAQVAHRNPDDGDFEVLWPEGLTDFEIG